MLDELINIGTRMVSRETQTVTRVALDRIVDNPYQYRRHYREESLHELTVNINSLVFQLPKTSGLQQPGMGRLVRRDGAGVETPVDAAAYANQVALARLFDLDWHLTIVGSSDRDTVCAHGLAALAEELGRLTQQSRAAEAEADRHAAASAEATTPASVTNGIASTMPQPNGVSR